MQELTYFTTDNDDVRVKRVNHSSFSDGDADAGDTQMTT
jgi:hypothetical protein